MLSSVVLLLIIKKGSFDHSERYALLNLQMQCRQCFQMAAPLIMSGKPQAAPSQFPIGGVDDLMWHDPNGDLKKWQRDTGVSLWGDPEKNSTFVMVLFLAIIC